MDIGGRAHAKGASKLLARTAALIACALAWTVLPAQAPRNAESANIRIATDWCLPRQDLNQTCFTRAFANGFKGTVLAPPGQYRIDETVDVPTGVALMGSAAIPERGTIDPFGSPTLLIRVGSGTTSVPAFRMHPGSSLQGFRFIWPDQSDSYPVPYGWAITSTGQPADDLIKLSNLMLVNPYLGINQDFGGQWEIESIYGQPIKIGLRLNRVFDGTVIQNVHFWPFWRAKGPGFDAIQHGGTCLLFERVDGVNATNIECYGYHRGLDFERSRAGSAWANISNFVIDSVAQPIFIGSANVVNLSNGTLSGSTTAGYKWGISTGASVGLRANIAVSNVVVFALFGGALITSASGNFSFFNFAAKAGSDNEVQQTGTSDLMGPLLVSTSGANVQVFGAHSSLSALFGNIWAGPNTTVNGVPYPQPTSDVTPPALRSPSSWHSSPHVTTTPSSIRLDLRTGDRPTSLGQSFEDAISPGVYVMRFTIQILRPCKGPCQLSFELLDSTGRLLARWPWSTFSVENMPQGQSLLVQIPLVIRSPCASARWVFGGGLDGAVRISSMSLWATAEGANSPIAKSLRCSIFSTCNGGPTRGHRVWIKQ